MFNTIYLGSTPADEVGSNIGDPNYSELGRKESCAYKRQLQRIMRAAGFDYQALGDDFRLLIKTEAHDLGSYFEVIVRAEAHNPDAIKLAYWLEENSPLSWDQEAIAYLQDNQVPGQ